VNDGAAALEQGVRRLGLAQIGELLRHSKLGGETPIGAEHIVPAT
jgi:hypothetical protein